MSQAHMALVDEVLRLPLEKIGKAVSYVRFLGQEAEAELWLDDLEEDELHRLRAGEFVDSADLLARIEGLVDD